MPLLFAFADSPLPSARGAAGNIAYVHIGTRRLLAVGSRLFLASE